MMYPYSYSDDRCPTWPVMQKLIDFVNERDFCTKAADSDGCLRSGPGSTTTRPSYDAPATAGDYMYEVMKVPHSYTWEIFYGSSTERHKQVMKVPHSYTWEIFYGSSTE